MNSPPTKPPNPASLITKKSKETTSLSPTSFDVSESLMIDISPPDLEIRDFARFRAWWKTDIFRLGHNALRAELFDFYVIVTTAQRLRYRITAEHAKLLSEWWTEFRGYLKTFCEADKQIIFPWIERGLDDPSDVSATIPAMADTLEDLGRVRDEIICDLDFASESILTLGERSANALPVILPKVFESTHNVIIRLVKYMDLQENCLVPIIEAVYTEDDKFVMDLLYVQHFYKEASEDQNANLIFLSRWMDENGMVTYWLDTNLPKSVKSGYLEWKEDFLARHSKVIDDLKIAESKRHKQYGLSFGENELLESGMSESSEMLFSPMRDDQEQSLKRILLTDGETPSIFSFPASSLCLVEHGKDWAFDIFSMGGNASRVALSQCCEILTCMKRISAWSRSDYCNEFARWFRITYEYLVDMMSLDEEILLPRIFEITAEQSNGATMDAGKAKYESRKVRTALEVLNTQVLAFLDRPSGASFNQTVDYADSLVNKSAIYLNIREELLPDHLRNGLDESAGYDLAMAVVEYLAESRVGRGSLVVHLYWMDPTSLQTWAAQHIKGNIKPGFNKALRKVGVPYSRIYQDFNRRAFPSESTMPRSKSTHKVPRGESRLKSMGRADSGKRGFSLSNASRGLSHSAKGMASMGRSAGGTNQSRGLGLLREKSRKATKT